MVNDLYKENKKILNYLNYITEKCGKPVTA